MKYYSSKFACCGSAFAFALTAVLAACGDENTTEVSESTGLNVVAKGDSLPECGSENAGEMIYVSDSSAVYYCAEEKWSLLKGEDGKKGSSGIDGDNGVSCTAKKVDDGIEMSCDGEVVGTFVNGKNGESGSKGTTGEKGQNGDNGSNCTAHNIDNGIEISCNGKVVGVLKNGEPGESVNGKNGNSCSAAQDEESKNIVITCETDDGKGVSYTIPNGSNGKSAYEIAKENGFEGTIVDWLMSLNGEDGDGMETVLEVKDGENCSATANENGTYTIHCAGSEDVVIKNGKSAYEASGSTLTPEKWIESLKGEKGTDCVAVDTTNSITGQKGYKITCGDESMGALFDGFDGKPGTDCKAEDKGDGRIEVTCGDGKTKNTVTLNKATCGLEYFEPTVKFCVNAKLYDKCNGDVYDPTKEFCFDGGVLNLCGTRTYDPAKKFCFNAKLYDKCNGENYDTAKQFCFDDGLYDFCGSRTYDPKKSGCLGKSIYTLTKGTLKDPYGDGQEYKIVTIDVSSEVVDNQTQETKIVQYNETWMAENLNYNYNVGTAKSWCYNEGVSEEESAQNCKKYGRLYMWSAAMDSAAVFSSEGKGCGYEKGCSSNGTVRGVCPEGWHLPSNTEWNALADAVGGSGYAGHYLKSTDGWENGANGTDIFGFTALPAGRRHVDGWDRASFVDESKYAYFWTKDYRDYFYVHSGGESVGIASVNAYYGHSVRCIKNKVAE